MDGKFTIDLVGRCFIAIYDKRVMPEVIIGLACPRVDYIKMWPFPIEQPWDGYERPFREGPELLTKGLSKKKV